MPPAKKQKKTGAAAAAGGAGPIVVYEHTADLSITLDTLCTLPGTQLQVRKTAVFTCGDNGLKWMMAVENTRVGSGPTYNIEV